MTLDTEELEALRRRAFAIAYRMLGSVSEARGVASIVNPDKLRHIATVGSMRDALASVRGRGSS